MASNIDLNINIGANVTDLQAQLQKAENLLKQFEAALKKATNVGEINYLNGQIKNLNTTITSLNQKMNTIGKPTADATNALTNLSRVAQDAPYGFIGIANNLNPLLESFQRLQKESGSAGKALKSMVSGLTGPAGIGLALGAVSSIIVAFGDDISEFITEKMQGLGKSFQMESDLITKSSDAYVKATTDIDKLRGSYSDFQNGFITKEKFLKQFNSTLGDTIKQTNDLATAEKFLTDYADTYIEMTFKKAIATEASAQAAKKMLELEISKGTPITPGIGTALTAMFGNPAMIGKQAAESKIALQDGLQSQIDILKNLRKKYDLEADELQKSITNTFGVVDINQTTTKPKKDKTLSYQDATNQINARIRTNDLLTPLPQAPEDTYLKKQEKQHEEYLKWLTGWTKRKEKLAEQNIDKENKDLEELTKSYERFAETISNTVTNALMSMFDAMQQGENPLQAIGQMFANIAKQIAAAVIQAIIFKALLDAFPALKGVFTAMGAASSGGGIGKLLGMASGGIATGPTLAMIGEGPESEAVLPLSKLSGMLNRTFSAGAMSGTGNQNGQFVLRGQDLVLAMQRSNSSLNLRRG